MLYEVITMKAFVEELSRVKFSFITGVNTLFNGLLNTPGFDQLDFSSLKIALGGGIVITSYSIHYTKLYDLRGVGP